MKKVTRNFNLITGCSLLLCLAVTALWVRSYWRWDHLDCEKVDFVIPPSSQISSEGAHMYFWGAEEMRYTVCSSIRGELRVFMHVSEGSMVYKDGSYHWSFRVSEPGLSFGHHILFKRYLEYEDYVGWRWCPYIALPHALPAGLFAILPAFWLVRRLLRRKRGEFDCRVCGYDLRESSTICPECGTAIRPSRTD